MVLTGAQRLKFRLLAEGLTIASQARIRLDELRGQRELTPADYASTSGLILRLDHDVWVNAPFADHNANFVKAPRSVLHVADGGFVVASEELQSPATVWLPPRYHGGNLSTGRPINHFVFTHGDRVRLSPIGGCAMRCQFCNIPYEDQYQRKPLDLMMEALKIAVDDPLQPAQHIMISGGTPVPRDIPFLREVYERVLLEFAPMHVDIMMVPVDGLFDLERLKELGVHELSINIELFNTDVARRLMPQKEQRGAQHYLDFVARASSVLGQGRVRSMLLVGLEPVEDTLAGVQAIVEAGGVPVLSPFRPDPSTPLRDLSPLSAEAYEDVFLRATDVAAAHGARLGPSCPPCTHNTLTLVPSEPSPVRYPYALPAMV